MSSDIYLGNIHGYRIFINKCANENLTLFDRIIYNLTKWNSLIYKAAYELYLKKIIKTRTRHIKSKGKILTSLLYVEIYNRRFYYDNQQEIRKFKKWVKE